jgi:hypothetical protein
MTLNRRVAKLEEGLRPPECVPVRQIRTQRKYGPPYEFTPDDRCPTCGVLGCGIRVITEVIVVGRTPQGTFIDDHGNEFVPERTGTRKAFDPNVLLERFRGE